MIDKHSLYRRAEAAISPNVVDRILVGLCAAVWLLLVGMSVAAIVALVDLGRGFHQVARNSHTTWALYLIIAVSALVIVAAIPVLLRARRATEAEPAARAVSDFGMGRQSVQTSPLATTIIAGQDRTDRLIGVGFAAGCSAAAVDRVWLRGTIILMSTMGAALVAVAAATYLMAVGRDGSSWTSYAIAGAITMTIPAIPWRHNRHLRLLIAHRSSLYDR